MLAFVLDNRGARLVADRPRPAPAEGYARARVIAAGICNTDLEIARGYMGFQGVLGHEFVGVVTEGPMAGRRVAGEINFGCGACEECARGLARHCEHRRVMGILGADGALAEEVSVPIGNLVALPDSIDDEDAVFVEPLAAACEVLEQLGEDRPRGVATVLGGGKLGPLVAQVLAADGYDVVLVARHVEALGWLSRRGVRVVGTDIDLPRCGLVVDATGSREGLQRAIALAAPRGTLVLKTTVAGNHDVDLSPIVINELHVLGSRCGRFAPAIELLRTDAVDVAPLVTDRYSLSRVEEAFTRAAAPGVRKILVRVTP
jgi:threonine dehydrogenase-like Zn-dependent dehydrogenase